MNEYKKWCESTNTEGELKAELLSLTDSRDIEDRFYRTLEFGTAGLRGVLGAGTNRMNLHIVRQASKALADYINATGRAAAKNGVAIAYDSRNMSREFAKAAALVLCKNNVKAYLFDDLRPVPVLSFAVRHLGCTAGIVITASHNPPEYNGYKVYWQDGGQITPDRCKPIAQLIEKTDALLVEEMLEGDALQSGLLEYIGKDVDNAYYDYTLSLCAHKELTKEQKNDIKVVYTPLHGSGLVPVCTLLNRSGYNNLYVVPSQEKPDGNFPTVKSPNPENKEAFECALLLAAEVDADIILASDPDADRLGVCVRGKNGYIKLTGNKIGAFLVNYLLSAYNESGAIAKDAYVVESIVSTRLVGAICKEYGVTHKYVLTGFRYIAEQIEKSDVTHEGTFIFGFEESYGFLTGTRVRDKDACLAAMLMTEACAYYKTKGKSVYDVLCEIDDRFGAYDETCISLTMSGKDGMEKLATLMKQCHEKPLKEIGKRSCVAYSDYLSGKRTDYCKGEITQIDLPSSDVVIYELENDVWVCIRPSGTEPKLKIYVGAHSKTQDEASKLASSISNEVVAVLKI